MAMERGLTTKQKLVAQYLALGYIESEAGKYANVSLAVVKKWQHEPLFQGEVQESRDRAFKTLEERLVARMEALQEPALERMGRLLNAESESVQLHAAEAILDKGPLGEKKETPPGGVALSLDKATLEVMLKSAVNAGEVGVMAAFRAIPEHANGTTQGLETEAH